MGLSSSSSILSKSSLSLALPLAPFLDSLLRALEGFQAAPVSESESEMARLGAGADFGLGFSATGFFLETPKSESSSSSISDLILSSSSSVLSQASFFFLGAGNDKILENESSHQNYYFIKKYYKKIARQDRWYKLSYQVWVWVELLVS